VPTASSTFDGGLNSVRDARRFLSWVLREWNTDEFDFGAPQVLSELATNAALHARSSFTVTVELVDQSLLLEVTDSSVRVPRTRHYAPDATTGRGMGLVAALSVSWGTSASTGGKTVWARVAPDGSLMRDFDVDGAEDFGDLGVAGGPVGVSRRTRHASRSVGCNRQREARAS
jgi:anti-sigma regulatory factor (Ser/Thr protein kinase)